MRAIVGSALILALASALAGTAIIVGLLAIAGADTLPYAAALGIKMAYGALLALVVTPVAIRRVL